MLYPLFFFCAIMLYFSSVLCCSSRSVVQQLICCSSSYFLLFSHQVFDLSLLYSLVHNQNTNHSWVTRRIWLWLDNMRPHWGDDTPETSFQEERIFKYQHQKKYKRSIKEDLNQKTAAMAIIPYVNGVSENFVPNRSSWSCAMERLWSLYSQSSCEINVYMLPSLTEGEWYDWYLRQLSPSVYVCGKLQFWCSLTWCAWLIHLKVAANCLTLPPLWISRNLYRDCQLCSKGVINIV